MHSPVKSDVLNKELIGYNTALRNYLISGFQYGFTCASIKKNVDKISDFNEGNDTEAKITLKHIVLGYKIDDKNYLALNFLITVVGFSIYKSYYISEQKTKYINVYRIFVNEYIKRIKENKTLQKYTFVIKVKNYIQNAK